MKIIFKEKQKFTQWWLWTLIIGAALIPAYGVYKETIIENNASPSFELIVILVFALAFITFFWVLELRTEINKDEIKVRFFPFITKVVKWDDIKSAQIKNYGFVGGWGIRLSTKYGTVYNTKGDKGLTLELKNDKKLCIGTQKEKELKKVIAEVTKEQFFVYNSSKND